MGKRKVKVKRINWDATFFHDIFTGDGFIISEPAEVRLDGSKQKSLYGPQSPLYGTTYEDENAFIERYRCQCGEFKGRQFEGHICPLCGQPVEDKGSNIKITGWICLGEGNKVINPYYYRILQKALGSTVFTDIVEARYKITTDGNKVRPTEEDNETEPSSIYAGMGIDEFYDKYDEVLCYFKEKRKNQADVIERLRKQKSCVFISHYPVLSTFLRPQSVTSDTYYYNSIDKIINTIFSLSENLKNCIDVERDYILKRLQEKVNKSWDILFEELNGKKGIIRGDLLGGSLNYTARNVIIPDPTLKINEIDISYHTFLEVFKYKVIYYIMKLEDCTLAKAYSKWKKAASFSQYVYDIMQWIVEKEKIKLLINRNPTLNYYSMLLMKIRKVKKDGHDYALSVPLPILPGLNADFDGDILNMIGIVHDSIAYMFRKFDPISRMIIDRDTSLLNTYFSLQKDQIINLYYFATIGQTKNDQEQTYAVKDNKSGEIIYVPKGEVKKYKSGIVDPLLDMEINPI